MTIFSCSRYCGTNDNKGAFIVLNDNQSERFTPMFHSYFAEVDEEVQLDVKEVDSVIVIKIDDK